MSEAFEYAEHRATLPGDLGYECTFYNGIRWRTAPLRERLYVAVEVEGHEFRPRGAEHFPADECTEAQGINAGFGAGGTVEVLFRCYAPEGSGGAGEGVGAIAAALEELAGRVGMGHWSRSMAAGTDKARYVRLVGPDGNAAPRPYRPSPGVLPAKGRAHEPGPSIGDVLGAMGGEVRRLLRADLERRGMLEDYDRMMADLFRPAPRPRAPTAPKASAPWTPPPEPEWLTQHREFEEQQKAMEAKYGRMGGTH